MFKNTLPFWEKCFWMTTSKPWPSNHCMCNWVQLLPINWTSNQNRPCRPLPHSPHFSLSLSLDVNCYVCKDCHLSLLFHVITLQTNLKVKLLFVHDVPPPQPLATLLVNDMHRSSPRVVLISSSPVVHSRLLVWNAVLWQSPLTNTRAVFMYCVRVESSDLDGASISCTPPFLQTWRPHPLSQGSIRTCLCLVSTSTVD